MMPRCNGDGSTKDVPPDCSRGGDRLLVHRISHGSKLHGPSAPDGSGLVGLCASFWLTGKSKMELQIHNVKKLSVKAELVDTPDDPYKVIQIKINGWSSVITLYCEKELDLDLDLDGI